MWNQLSGYISLLLSSCILIYLSVSKNMIVARSFTVCSKAYWILLLFRTQCYDGITFMTLVPVCRDTVLIFATGMLCLEDDISQTSHHLLPLTFFMSFLQCSFSSKWSNRNVLLLWVFIFTCDHSKEWLLCLSWSSFVCRCKHKHVVTILMLIT